MSRFRMTAWLAISTLGLIPSSLWAQDEITYSWHVSDTGNGNGVVEPGESAVLTLLGEMAPARVGFGATIMDILGGDNWDTGLIVSYDNLLGELTDDGDLVGTNIFNIEPFQLPIFFNDDFDASNPIPLYQIVWQPDDYTPRSVGLTSDGHDWNDVYTDEFGSNVAYNAIIQPGSFDISDSLPCITSWTSLSSGGPPPRLGGAMAYDADREVLVLFGGQTNTGSNGETWEWDGLSWTLVSETGPSRRSQARMCYDEVQGVCVLFGGKLGTEYFDDTWTWDGSEWVEVLIAGPSARDQHGMVYDSARDRVVLFGGWDGSFYREDTWEWDGASWTRLPKFGPVARRSPAMTFDPVRRVTLLFGGADGSDRFGDTWAWDGVSWRLLATSGPASRESCGLAWDTLRDVGVLFGGSSAGVLFDDTWEWDGASWVPVSQGDLARWDHMMVYDPAQGASIVFGGWDGMQRTNDTWAWRGTAGPLVTESPADAFAAPGDPVSFAIEAAGGEPIEYQWRRDGMFLSDGPTGTGSTIQGAITPQLDILDVGEQDEGYYDCIATNTCDFDISDLGRLQVDDACGGDSAVIFAGSDTVEGDTFGQSVALQGERLLVGAFRDVTGGIDSGSAYLFERDPDGTWSEVVKLLSPDRTFNDEFGWSVALIEGFAVVGANRPGQVGSVYIFEEGGGIWPLDQQLIAPDSQRDDRFGLSIAALASSAGHLVAIGANRHDGDAVDSGAAYIFKRESDTWVLMEQLLPDVGHFEDQFGRSVALVETSEGIFAAVGCQASDIAGTNTGAVYLYRLDASSWALETVLTAPDPSNQQWFGRDVSLAGFGGGEVCVVGAEQDDQAGEDAGAAYVYRRTGGQWGFAAKLIANDTLAGDRFGSSIAVTTTARGDTIVIGATGDVDAGYSSGSAYFFENTEGTWLQTDKVLPVAPNDDEEFGYSVAAQSFELGPVLAVGARLDDERGPFSGSVAVYEFPLGAPVFDSQPQDKQVDIGDPVTFSTSVSGSGPLTYQWYFEGQSLIDDGRVQGSTTDTLTLDPVEGSDAGLYQLSVVGACGEALSTPATLSPICRPDINGDGVVNTLDVITFLGFWSIRDPAADWNEDGIVNTIDMLAFLNDWVAGC